MHTKPRKFLLVHGVKHTRIWAEAEPWLADCRVSCSCRLCGGAEPVHPIPPLCGPCWSSSNMVLLQREQPAPRTLAWVSHPASCEWQPSPAGLLLERMASQGVQLPHRQGQRRAFYCFQKALSGAPSSQFATPLLPVWSDTCFPSPWAGAVQSLGWGSLLRNLFLL